MGGASTANAEKREYIRIGCIGQKPPFMYNPQTASLQIDTGLIAAVRDFSIEIEWISFEEGIRAFLAREGYRDYDGILGAIVRGERDDWLTLQEKRPFVACGEFVPFSRLNYVENDDVMSGRLITEHFIDEGHVSIGFMSPYPHAWAQGRYDGYIGTLREHGMEPVREHIFGMDCLTGTLDPVFVGFTHQRFPEIATMYVERLLSLGTRPSAVVCANDNTAKFIIAAMKERGLRVPEDIALAGVDDAIERGNNRWRTSKLTSVRQDGYARGYWSVGLLVDIIEGRRNRDGQSIEVPPRLIIRETSLKRSLSTAGRTALAFRRAVTDYIEMNFARDNVLPAVARHVGASKEYFLKKFHRTTGMKFGAYLNDLRLTKAAFFVKDTTRTMVDILYDVGFSTEKTFYLSFRRKFGCSPQTYRARHHKRRKKG